MASIRHAAAVALLPLCVWSCGPSAPPPTMPAPPVVTPPATALTTGRVVNALNREQGLPGASITAEGIDASTDASGYFSLAAPPVAEPRTLRVAGAGWIERHTLFRVPGSNVDVSLIPSAFDMTYFDEMCRSFGRIVRWTTAPDLVVETSVIEYGSRVALAETVPDAFVLQTTDEIRRTIGVLSAGRYTTFPFVEIRRTPPGTASPVRAGAITISWQRGLLTGFGHVAYGGRAFGADGALTSGEVALDYDWRVFGLPAGSRRDIVPVEQHELGHAMGYSHTARAPSFMYQVFLMTVSALDREAFEIFMQRPTGNQSPDRDPSGTSLNMTAPGGMVVERCEMLRPFAR